MARDIADRSNGRVARLSGTLCDRIGDGEDLRGLLVEEQVIVPKIRSRDMPVEILRLQIQRITVRQDDLESFGNGHCRGFIEIGRCWNVGGTGFRHRLDFPKFGLYGAGYRFRHEWQFIEMKSSPPD